MESDRLPAVSINPNVDGLSRPPTTCTSQRRRAFKLDTHSLVRQFSEFSQRTITEREMVITGVLSLSNFWTTGGVASSGKLRTTCDAIAHVLRCGVEVSIQFESPMTNEVPWADMDRSSSIPSRY